MEHFSALHLFISVVDTGSFSSAGEALGISTSVVSRQIVALETELGTRLLKRSTRRVELTEAGSIYLKRVRSLLTELEETNRSLKNPNSTAAGRFRIVTSTAIGLSLIVPAIADFMAANPGVAIHLDLLDRVIDPQEEDYDLVLQFGDISEVAGPMLAQIEVGLFSSPAYLSGEPAELEPSRQFRCKTQNAVLFEPAGGSQSPMPSRTGHCTPSPLPGAGGNRTWRSGATA
jgi:DNA-binding transcriptional LysR family regulator